MRTSKLNKFLNRMKAMIVKNASRLAAAASMIMTSALCSINAYASNQSIDTNFSISGNLSNLNVEGMILGLAFWIARLVGVGMLVWGIYGYVTARKDGEAESMNGAIGKLISGVVLVAMPSVLKALGVVA